MTFWNKLETSYQSKVYTLITILSHHEHEQKTFSTYIYTFYNFKYKTGYTQKIVTKTWRIKMKHDKRTDDKNPKINILGLRYPQRSFVVVFFLSDVTLRVTTMPEEKSIAQEKYFWFNENKRQCNFTSVIRLNFFLRSW